MHKCIVDDLEIIPDSSLKGMNWILTGLQQWTQ